MKRRWKVLLCGYYGMGNLGDELLAAASIHLLESCGVSRDEIAMLSGSPEESFRVHRIFSIDRFDVKKIFSALHDSETLLLGGGGIFQDSSSFRSTVYYWGVVRAARLVGCRVWAVGQSIGPLSHFFGRALARDAFRCCDSVSVRDEHSFDFLEKSRFCARNIILTEDLALSRTAEFSHLANKNLFLVNFRVTRENLETAAAVYLKNLRISTDLRVVGVAMDKDDAKLMDDLSRNGLLAIDEICMPTINDVEKIFSRACCGFGMRLHFGVLCLRAGIPFSMVPYDPKVSDFVRRWNVPLWTDVVATQEKQEDQEKYEKQEGEINFSETFKDLDLSKACTDFDFSKISEKIREDFFACYDEVMHRAVW